MKQSKEQCKFQINACAKPLGLYWLDKKGAGMQLKEDILWKLIQRANYTVFHHILEVMWFLDGKETYHNIQRYDRSLTFWYLIIN